MTQIEFDRLFKPASRSVAFDAWMKEVDAIIGRYCGGLTSAELADYCYLDAFEDEATPMQAASAAIRATL